MDRQVSVNLKFNADTSSAQSAIQNLQQSLQNIANTKVTVQGSSIDQAAQSAKLLSQHLAAATNTKTGKLDFSALRASLKGANTDLATLSNNLLAMGPKGQQAFSQLSAAIAHADLSIKKTNSTLANFGVTLMNTIKWQASSTLIHGVMGAFSSAVGHIKNLDKALNDIQIVTNKTANDMANFARQAQDLSKALSTTTTEYARASLIYFQQGLEDNDVLRRTEATLKMAKVTGDSVETVSNQLTAIWNNFDNGTQSLEHYADVLTALGAATASSTDEIAEGLQRFAAIAETVGLSYEYAASALATITAETRQSATVVGTALNTIFARMEGLQLGETLDDGTTLNKYSAALAKVGINIKDANGDLKDMNSILNQMGEKWKILNKDQQIALAQTVGGVRQYNQLMALMNNWDTFKLNVEISEESKGTLDEQFKIYQNGVEASEAALKNAKEALYETLFNSKALKDFNNKLADILEMIKRIVDSAGGLNGLLKFGGLVLLKTLLPKLQGFITNITGQISNVIGLTKRNQIAALDTQSRTQKKIAGVQEQPLSDQTKEKIAKHNVKAEQFEDGTIRQKYHQLRAQGIAQDASMRMTKSTDGEMTMPKEAQVGVPAEGSTAVTSSQMASQIDKESAIYNAQIIDARKEYLMVEDQLTDKQKLQFQNYVDQIQAEKDLLDIARERQLVSKKQFEESKQKVQATVDLTDDGQGTERAAQRKVDSTEIGRKKQESDKRLTTAMAEKAEITRRKDKETDKQYNKRQKQNSGQLAEINKRIQAELNHEDRKVYDQEVEARMFDRDIGGKIDLGRGRTARASERLRKQTENATGSDQEALQKVQSAAGMDDGGAAIAGTESLERLGQLQGEYNSGARMAVELQTELGRAIEVAKNGAEKTGKSQKSVNNTIKQTVKFAEAYSDEFKSALKATGKTDDEVDRLIKRVKKLNNEAEKVDFKNMSKDELDQIEKDLNDIGKAVGTAGKSMSNASTVAGQMVNTMADDMAKTSGTTKEAFVDMSNNARLMVESASEAEQQAERTQGAMNKPLTPQPDPFGAAKQGAQELMNGITNLSMGATSLSTGLTMAFDPNATGIETLTGLMMTMQGVMSLLNATQLIYNGILFTTKAVEFLVTKGKEKGLKVAAKELIAKLLDTGATTTNAVAKVFNAEASKGLAGIIAGALAAAIIVGTVAMVASTVATNKNTEKKQKAAEASAEQAEKEAELAEKIREEYDSLIELTQAYEDALKLYQETGQGKAELIDAAIEVIKATNDESMALALAAENYELLTEKIYAYNRAKAGDLKEQSNKAITDTTGAFLAKVSANGGTTGNMGLDATTRDDSQALVIDLGWGTGDDVTVLEKWFKANPDSGWEIYEGDELIAKYKDPKEIPGLLKNLQNLRQGVTAIASQEGYDMSSMGLFTAFDEMDEEGEWEAAEGVISTADTSTDNIIEASKSHIDDSKAITMDQVKTQTDYESAREAMALEVLRQQGLNVSSLNDIDKLTVENKKKAEDLLQQIEANLLNDEAYKNFEVRHQAREQLIEVAGEGSVAETFMEDGGLEKWAQENDLEPEEALDLYFKIQPQYFSDDEALQEALDLIQKQVDAQKIIVKYDLISGAKTDLKEQMSAQDWRQWYEKNKDLFNPTSASYIGKTFQDFANMNYTEQQGWLTTQQGSAVQANKENKEAAEETLETYQTEEYKENFIETEKEQKRKENQQEQQKAVNELEQEYGKDTVAALSRGEGITRESMQAYYEQYNVIDAVDRQNQEAKWAQEIYDQYGISSLEEWFALQDKYASIQKAGDANEATLQSEAEAAYVKLIEEQKGKIQAYDDEIFLSTLDEADKTITEYDLKAEEVYNLADSLSELALTSDEVADSLADDEAAAKQVAVQISRFNKAVDSLDDSYEDWLKTLKSGNLSDVAKTTNELRAVYADLLDLDPSDFTDEFLSSVENLKLAQKAAAGDMEAYNQLQIANIEALGEKYFEAGSTIITTLSEIAALDTLDVGEKITVGGEGNDLATTLMNFYNAAVQEAIRGGESVQEAQAYAKRLIESSNFAIDSMGEMEFTTVTVTGQLPSGWEPVQNGGFIGPDGQPIEGVSWQEKKGDEYTYTYTYQHPKGMTFSKKAETFGGKKPKKSSGDGGNSTKTSDARKDKSETVERYKEINDKLDDSSRAMDKASKAADRLYGASRLKALDKLNKALKEEIKNLEAKKKQTEEYLALDREALDKAAAETELGIKFEYDENGNITNYDEMMTIIHNAREALLDSFGDTIDEDEQKQLDAFDKKVENVVNKQEQYDDTREEKEDVEDEIEDRYNQWQDNNYEKLSYKLELKLEINDRELELIDTKLDLIADDVFKRAEGLALLSSKIEPFKETATDLVDQKATLDTALANGDISQEDYVEGLKEIYSATISNVQAMKEFDEAMKSYYGDTLDMANEEIKKYTDHMEHSVSVLDHYSSLLDIFGESTDYKKMGTILKGQADVLGDQVTVAKQTLEMNKAAADDRWKEYQEALNRGDSAAAELHKEEYFKALAAADEAEENFLAKSEEWAEALKAVLENALKDAGKELEKALTDGMSFDALATKMERASSLQEEYLTNTNKIYETNKMINTAQQAIDKTTNTVAKQRLANFQKETAQLQKKEKLSQYELDIQQAKYDLLLAQITLEEAQQAKSTVRLQRDSEGNFGYVYTADQNQIADAQQKMLDAENALYNKGLEGANDYVQKYQQTMQEMYDTLTEIQEKYLNGEYETYEEYQTAMIEAQDYYYQKLQDYSDLYKVAISADNRVVADAWSSNFSDMVFNTEQWMVEVTGYIGDVSLKFQEWNTTVKTLKEGTLGDNLDALAGKVKTITDESKNFVKILTDEKEGVISSLNKEIAGVGGLTTEYGKNRAALLLLTDAQLDYAESVHKTVEAQAKLLTANGDDSESNSSSGSNSGSSSGGDSGSGSSNDVNKLTSPTGPKEKPTTPPKIKLYMSGDLTGGTKTFSADKIKSMIPEGNDGKLYRAVYRAEDHGSEYIYTNKEQADTYNNYIASLDTGGYTGSWGHEGKLAMLHEKELILNAQDTSNFLESLEVLREIMKTIDLHSSYAQISGMLSSPIYRDYNEPQILEQQVHIEASFPGVQDRNEIEEAFNNLMNRATQFVNRK